MRRTKEEMLWRHAHSANVGQRRSVPGKQTQESTQRPLWSRQNFWSRVETSSLLTIMNKVVRASYIRRIGSFLKSDKRTHQWRYIEKDREAQTRCPASIRACSKAFTDSDSSVLTEDNEITADNLSVWSAVEDKKAPKKSSMQLTTWSNGAEKANWLSKWRNKKQQGSPWPLPMKRRNNSSGSTNNKNPSSQLTSS